MTGFLISAAHKSSGKTITSIGLASVLNARGHKVQCFKKGPDYIDPKWLSLASIRPCMNLDFYTTEHREILQCFARYSEQADIVIVEGNKGLYDGVDTGGSDSTAALAQLLGLPVVLVIDTQGITRGIAPLLLGYESFAHQINIAGIILNNVASSRHEQKLRAAVERYTDLAVFGVMYRSPGLGVPERHLGLMPSNEVANAQQCVSRIADAVDEAVDIDALIKRCDELNIPSALAAPGLPKPRSVPLDVTIGVARDSTFGFYYPDDIETFERAGAHIECFDAINDTRLPEVDALFIGGGFPETHISALHQNHAMRAAIRSFIDAGNPVYAECGGLMYLCRSLCWNDESKEMVGAIPADVVMRKKPFGRGYVKLRKTINHPWGIATDDDGEINAHEFHYSRLENLSDVVEFAYDVIRGTGVDGQRDGIVYKNVLATYSHQRNVGSNTWVYDFVQYVRDIRSVKSIPALKAS
ncbi:MAG: cobyrinate a,c-diamide synthase [Gammaproteobacteria bacterium]|nr:cobyrinate a,c-diamide synthase [Gammaproteobacteria bacterium]